MARSPVRHLLGRLWPTRRRFEMRHYELLAAVQSLQGSVEQARQRLEQLASQVGQVSHRQEQMFIIQAELKSRMRRTQALTARVYETLQNWPDLLSEARAEQRYEEAYADPRPLVSIPIPTFRSPDTLCDRALASVRAQTYTNWEAIVVGDHCQDDTEARVREIGDERIRFHNLPVRENDPEDPWERWAVKGSVPRSVGIGLAGGAWIAPLSHDDAWDPDHLETLLSAAQATRTEVVYSRMRVVESESAEHGPARSHGVWPPRMGEWNWQCAMFNGALRFLRYDRACALASEPNDWNLARRAWEAGVRFHFVDRETASLYVYPRAQDIEREYASLGLPSSAAACP